VTRRLIVNADDFGLTPGVSAGILDAHRHGIVTSTTVLVTADIDGEQLARARDSGIGMGIHVNLTLGKPLTPARSLVDGNGNDWGQLALAAVGALVLLALSMWFLVTMLRVFRKRGYVTRYT